MSHIERVLKQLTRDAALKRMESHSGISGMTVSDLDADYKRKVHANWMSIILVSGLDLRVTFKSYFNCLDVKEIIHQSMGTPKEEIKDDFAMDFIKEFCNLTAGMIQKSLAAQSYHVGISLPMVTRGFDDLFYKPSSMNEIADMWRIETCGIELICAANFNIINSNKLESIEYVSEEEDDDDGEIDFL